MITQAQMGNIMQMMFNEETQTRAAGQKEYARDEANAFANFEWIAQIVSRGGTPISREQVLMVYLLKHLDGVMSYINGHRSQREDVRGRIKDMRVYLALLRGMIEEAQSDVASFKTYEPTGESPTLAEWRGTVLPLDEHADVVAKAGR